MDKQAVSWRFDVTHAYTEGRVFLENQFIYICDLYTCLLYVACLPFEFPVGFINYILHSTVICQRLSKVRFGFVLWYVNQHPATV